MSCGLCGEVALALALLALALALVLALTRALAVALALALGQCHHCGQVKPPAAAVIAICEAAKLGLDPVSLC